MSVPPAAVTRNRRVGAMPVDPGDIVVQAAAGLGRA